MQSIVHWLVATQFFKYDRTQKKLKVGLNKAPAVVASTWSKKSPRVVYTCTHVWYTHAHILAYMATEQNNIKKQLRTCLLLVPIN